MFITRNKMKKMTKKYGRIIKNIEFLFSELSELSTQKTLSFKIIWLTLNVDEDSPYYDSWLSIRRCIMLYDDWVIRNKHKINISGYKRLPTIAI